MALFSFFKNSFFLLKKKVNRTCFLHCTFEFFKQKESNRNKDKKTKHSTKQTQERVSPKWVCVVESQRELEYYCCSYLKSALYGLIKLIHPSQHLLNMSALSLKEHVSLSIAKMSCITLNQLMRVNLYFAIFWWCFFFLLPTNIILYMYALEKSKICFGMMPKYKTWKQKSNLIFKTFSILSLTVSQWWASPVRSQNTWSWFAFWHGFIFMALLDSTLERREMTCRLDSSPGLLRWGHSLCTWDTCSSNWGIWALQFLFI